MALVKLLVVLLLVAIVFSLGSALWQLARGTRDSSRLLRALTWRITLSILLFALLFLAYWLGLIGPHQVTP